MTRLLEVFGIDHQHKVVGDADLARDFKARAYFRKISDAAIDTAGAVKSNAASFERAMARNLSLVIGYRRRSFFQFPYHCDPPSLPAPACSCGGGGGLDQIV